MIYAEGVYAFGGLLLGYILFLSLRMGVAPWKLWLYNTRVLKKDKDNE